MKRKHFLFTWILVILLVCAACTDTGNNEALGGNTGTDTSSAQSTVTSGIGNPSDSTVTDTATSSSTDGENLPSQEDTDTESNISHSTQTDSTTASTATDTNTTPSTSTDTQSKPSTTDTATKPSTGTTNSSKPSTNTGVSGGGTQDTGTTEKEPLNAIAPENYYGRTWLTEQSNGKNLVAAYDNIVQTAEAMGTRTNFTNYLTQDELYTVFHCYRNDYPEHFWVDRSYTYSTEGSKVRSITLKYTMSATEKASTQKEFNKAVDKLLEGLDGSMNQFDMEKILHDRLVLSVTYKDGTHAHDAYGALVEHSAVCDGYARAFQLLCRKVGIRAMIVEGESASPGSTTAVGHAWNVVQINGKYYHTDVTWDDAGEPQDEHGIHYAWFNITTKQLAEDHVLSDSGYAIPKCDAEDENYFLKTGKWLEEMTVDGIVDLLEDHGGEYHAHIYIKNPGNVKEFFQKNISAIASKLKCSRYSYKYQTTGHGLYIIITPK